MNILELYLTHINSEILLNKQQEAQLSLKIQQGDLKAKQQMIRSNLRLVVVTFHDNLLGLSRCNLLETKLIKNALPASLLQLRCNSPCHFTCS
jgi:hypothetical protein